MVSHTSEVKPVFYRTKNLVMEKHGWESSSDLIDFRRSISINSWHVNITLSITYLLKNTIFVENHLSNNQTWVRSWILEYQNYKRHYANQEVEFLTNWKSCRRVRQHSDCILAFLYYCCRSFPNRSPMFN